MLSQRLLIASETWHHGCFQLEKKLDKNPASKADWQQYADTMGDYLQIGFLDEKSQKTSEKAYAAILETLLSLDTTEKKYFIAKINCEMKLENYTKAKAFCEIFSVEVS